MIFGREAHMRITQRGLTLVELMVSMALGLVLVMGVTQVFLSTQQTYRTREAMSRVQETGRLSLAVLSNEIRKAGFTGCRRGEVANHIHSSSLDLFTAQLDIGLEVTDGDGFGHPDSDAIIIRSMTGGLDLGAVNISYNHGLIQSRSVPHITFVDDNGDPVPTGIPRGTMVVLSTCDGGGGDVFFNSDDATDTTIRRTPPGDGGDGRNMGPGQSDWSDGLVSGGPVYLDVPSILVYYIDEITGPDGNEVRVLVREDHLGNAREVAEGVFAMRVEYGLDTTGDGQINEFRFFDPATLPADTGAYWRSVAALRIHLLVYSGAGDGVVDEPQTGLVFGDVIFDAPDRRLYQVFTTTVAARNLL